MNNSLSDGSEATLTPTPEPEYARRLAMKRVLLGLLVVALLLPIVAFSGERIFRTGEVLRGVYVDSESVSGLTEPGLRASLERLERRFRQRTVRIRIGQRIFRVEAARLGLKFDVPKTVARLLSVGRMGSIRARFRHYWRGWFASVSVTPAFYLDAGAIDALADEWERLAIAQRPDGGGVYFAQGTVQKRTPRAGWLINRDTLMSKLLSASGQAHGEIVALDLVEVMPEVSIDELEKARIRAEGWLQHGIRLEYDDPPMRLRLTREQLGRALSSHVDTTVRPHRVELSFSPASIKQYVSGPEFSVEAKDASFRVNSREQITIVPSRRALTVVPDDIVARIVQMVERGEVEGELPVRAGDPPKLTTEAAQKLGITRHLISFTTSHPCCRPRVQNIHRIADLMDGVVVLPGQTFSVNERVGRRTLENGFVPAPSIEDGEMVETVGGGISQFATTFFNAVLRAGLDVVSRQPHSYWFTRYPMGFEATLSWPKPDLAFRNDTDAGVLVKTEYSSTHIKVKLYGNAGGRKVVTKVSPRFDIVEPEIELVPRASLDVDEEKVVDGGSVGWSVMTTRWVTKDGATKEEKRKVVYSPQIRRVAVHPCRIPEGQEGYTGEPCPVPEDADDEAAAEGDGESTVSGEETSPATDGVQDAGAR